MNKVHYLILLFIAIIPVNSYACQGAPTGTATVKMSQTNEICLTVELKGTSKQSKCFSKGSKEYKKILKKYPNLKNGKAIIEKTEPC